MRKNIIVALLAAFFLGGPLFAQNGTTKGWSKEYRASSISECIKTAQVTIGEDSAKRYCQCMMKKVEEVYPLQKDADKLTKADLEKPAMKKMINECLTMQWAESDRKDFVNSCVQNAMALGEEKAKKYCNCMLLKMEVKYADVNDAGKITEADLAKPEFKKMIKACLD